MASGPDNIDLTPLPFSFPALGGKKVTAAFDAGRQTSDGGVLLLGASGAHTLLQRAPHAGDEIAVAPACLLEHADSTQA